MQYSSSTLQLMYQEHFTQTLRLHRKKSGLTNEEIAEKCDKSKSTVDKWVTGEQTAHGVALILLARCFGPAFFNDLYRPFGFGGVQDLESNATDPFCVNAALADGLALLSRALSDGHIDHTERPKVCEGLKELINQATALHKHLDGARHGTPKNIQ